jgi:hypothetical protein
MAHWGAKHVRGNYYRTKDGFLVTGQGVQTETPICGSCGDARYVTIDKRDYTKAAPGEVALVKCEACWVAP